MKRKKKFRLHGLLMLTTLGAHIIGISVIMIPSFALALVPMVLANPTDFISVVVFAHVITGTVAIILSIWIMGSWRLKQSLQYCTPKRKIMFIVSIDWLVTLTLGTLMYLILYWALF